MADKKISQLTAVSTPLAGTEVLPIVQSSSTVKVAVSDLTAGRAVSATEVTLTTGNLVIGTAGKGIDFSATAGTGTSELLDDYEEGTWTPTFTGWSVAPTSVVGAFYTKVGRQVTVNCAVNGGTCALGQRIGGLPFTVGTYSSATLRDFSGGTATSVGVPKTTTTEIWNLSAATFTGLYWGMSATYFI